MGKIIKIFDFKSLYPSIIRTFNIGWETLSNEENKKNCYITGSDEFKGEYHPPRYYLKEPKSLACEIMEIMLEKRNKIKKILKEKGYDKGLFLEQWAYKIIANSYFGFLSFPYSRFYNYEIGDSITTTGRWLIKKTNRFFEEKGFEVIANDTDSCFILMDEDIEVQKLLDEFHNKYIIQFLPEKHYIELEYEKEYKSLLYLKKKHYSALHSDGKFTHKGIEAIKSSTPKFARDFQLQIIEGLLKKELNIEKIKKIIKEKRKEVYSGNLKKEDVMITKSISKRLSEYKDYNIHGQRMTHDLHIRIAKQRFKKGLEVYPGQKISYIVTERITTQDGVYEEDYIEGTYDKDYYWESMYEPVLKVLEKIFPDENWKIFQQVTSKKIKTQIKKNQNLIQWF